MLGDISGLDRIYIVCGYTDMRKSIDGLCAIIEDQLKASLDSRSLFLFSRSFFADSSIHACLFRSLLLRFVSVPRTFLIFFLHSGQYFDIAEQGTYSTPHTVQFLGFNAVHRFVGVICNSPTKPMNL